MFPFSRIGEKKINKQTFFSFKKKKMLAIIGPIEKVNSIIISRFRIAYYYIYVNMRGYS